VNILTGTNGLFIHNFVRDRFYLIQWCMCFETVSSL